MKISTLLQRTLVAAAMTCLVAPGMQAQKVSRAKERGVAAMTQNLKKQMAQKKITASPSLRLQAINPADYGTIETLLFEDFSKFATGTEENPDLNTTVCLDWMNGEADSPWTNVDPSYTNMPGWGGANLFPAGGAVYMVNSLLDGEGHISTPDLDFTPYGGVAILQFRARTTNPKLNQMLVIESAETNHHGPEWRVLGGQPTDYLTEEWQTYSAIFFDAGPTTLFNIIPQMDREWYENKSEEPCQVIFDDFKVYSVNPYVDMPTGLGYDNYTGTEFDLRWDEMDADYYTVDVYAVDLKTGESMEFLSGVKAEKNSLHVSDAESGVDYMFNVTAYKGDKKSFPSLTGLVFDLEDPEFVGTPEFVKNEETGLYNFTSEWNDVPSAQVYDYALMHKRPAYNDGVFEVTNEDFTGIQDADGLTTEWTVQNPSYSCYGFLALRPLSQAGWIGKSYMPFKDFVCIDGWQHVVAKAEAYIASPELDLSKDEGRIHLSMKLFGRIGSWFDPIAQEQHDNLQTKAAVSLYNYDEATGEYVQAECVKIDDVTTAWNTFDVDLTKGSSRSFISIAAIEGPEHLYIDDLLITQNYKKGEYLLEPCIYEYWYEYSIIDLELPANSQGLELVEKVSAQKANPLTGEAAMSGYTSRELGSVGEVPAGIQDAAVAASIVTFRDGKLVINNERGEEAAVYTEDGKKLCASSETLVSLTLPGNAVYIVKVGGRTVKVTL